MALVLGVPPESKGGDFTPPKKGIYNCIVKSFEEVKNPFHEKNLAEGKVSDPTQLLWKFLVMDEGDAKGFEYWYYTGVRVGRSSKNKFTNLLKIVYPGFSLAAGAENVPMSEEDMKKVLYQPLRVVGDVTEPKEKKMDDGTTKMVTYGRVSDIWEPEGTVDRTAVEAAIAALGATTLTGDNDIPF